MKSLVTVVAVASALATATPAAALCDADAEIAVTPAGPQPALVHVRAGSLVTWRLAEDAQAAIRFDGFPCAPTLTTVNQRPGCFFNAGGRLSYQVDGFGAGAGVVEVEPVEWVTMRAERHVIVFGERARLRGTAYFGNDCGPPGPPGLSLVARVGGRSATRAVDVRRASFATVPWTTAVRPRRSTRYRASWSGFTSAEVRIDVRPRVTLRRAGGGRLRVTVRSLRDYRGRWVAVQRRTARGWRFARAVRLRRGSTVRFARATRWSARAMVRDRTHDPGRARHPIRTTRREHHVD